MLPFRVTCEGGCGGIPFDRLLIGQAFPMTVHTFHLANTSVLTTAKSIIGGPTASTVPGLQHAECMWTMKLGVPVVSPRRLQLQRFAMFASWDDEAAIDHFLANDPLGKKLAKGWHVRLDFIRRWGHITEFDGLPASTGESDPTAPVVAVTLARLKLPQLPRFIKWGKPVECLVRDDPGAVVALAATRPHRTVSTFTVWNSQQAMVDMVRGHADMPEPDRHATAMVERDRKDFHFEFTTLRFRPISEHGTWEGRTNLIPQPA